MRPLDQSDDALEGAAMGTLERGRAALVLIDLQARLLPAIAHNEHVLARALRLVEAARLLEVPVLATEHCPDRIGGTVPALAERLRPSEIHAKRAFSAAALDGFTALLQGGRDQLVLAGTEAHVCVLQTALGLRARGAEVVVVADAVGSRAASDLEYGLARLARSGVEVVTSEMVLFEWLGHADDPAFRAVHRLLR
jgi:nicotinamidase-related amidase